MDSQQREAFEALIEGKEEPPSREEMTTTTIRKVGDRKALRPPLVAVASAVIVLVTIGLLPSLLNNSPASAAERIEGRLPDGTVYRVSVDPPFESVEPRTISAAIVLDLKDEPETRERLGCLHQCRAVAIGVTTFSKTEPTVPTYEDGILYLSSGDWTMKVTLYADILNLWGEQAERILTDSIEPVDFQTGLPAFMITDPLRWGSDTELPLQMQVDYGQFVVQRGCGKLSVACSPSNSIQVIPSEQITSSAPAWDYEREVVVTDLGD